MLGAGPSGGPGALFAPEPARPDGKAAVVAYQPDAQAWAKAPGGTYHVGFWAGKPPRPEDIQRPELLDCYVVPTPAGDWLVPVARHFDKGTALPHHIYLGDDGKAVEGDVLERFAALSAHGDRVWDGFRAQQGLLDEGETPAPPIDDTEAFTIVAEALAFTYRVSAVEANLLARHKRWLPSDALRQVLRCLFDLPGWQAAEQARKEADEKKGRAGTPSG